MLLTISRFAFYLLIPCVTQSAILQSGESEASAINLSNGFLRPTNHFRELRQHRKRHVNPATETTPEPPVDSADLPTETTQTSKKKSPGWSALKKLKLKAPSIRLGLQLGLTRVKTTSKKSGTATTPAGPPPRTGQENVQPASIDSEPPSPSCIPPETPTTSQPPSPPHVRPDNARPPSPDRFASADAGPSSPTFPHPGNSGSHPPDYSSSDWQGLQEVVAKSMLPDWESHDHLINKWPDLEETLFKSKLHETWQSHDHLLKISLVAQEILPTSTSPEWEPYEHLIKNPQELEDPWLYSTSPEWEPHEDLLKNSSDLIQVPSTTPHEHEPATETAYKRAVETVPEPAVAADPSSADLHPGILAWDPANYLSDDSPRLKALMRPTLRPTSQPHLLKSSRDSNEVPAEPFSNENVSGSSSPTSSLSESHDHLLESSLDGQESPPQPPPQSTSTRSLSPKHPQQPSEGIAGTARKTHAKPHHFEQKTASPFLEPREHLLNNHHPELSNMYQPPSPEYNAMPPRHWEDPAHPVPDRPGTSYNPGNFYTVEEDPSFSFFNFLDLFSPSSPEPSDQAQEGYRYHDGVSPVCDDHHQRFPAVHEASELEETLRQFGDHLFHPEK